MKKTTKIIVCQMSFILAIVIIRKITGESLKDLFDYYLGLSVVGLAVDLFDK